MQNGSNELFDPFQIFRVLLGFFVMPRTALSGCGDKYCDNPKLGAFCCPHCDVDLVFDREAYEKDPKAVAQVPRSIEDGEILAHLATVVGAVTAPTEEEAHRKEMERLRREEELRRARTAETPPKHDDSEDAEWVKKTFKDNGFGQ
jgi:hypothetical protein